MNGNNGFPSGQSDAAGTRVGVLGGGRMGAGIAQVFATTGADVLVVESSEEAAAAARGRLATGLRRAAEHGKLAGPVEEVLARVSVMTDVNRFRDADLVVEALPEQLDLKVGMLAAVERVVRQETVLASNTSSLSVGDLAA